MLQRLIRMYKSMNPSIHNTFTRHFHPSHHHLVHTQHSLIPFTSTTRHAPSLRYFLRSSQSTLITRTFSSSQQQNQQIIDDDQLPFTEYTPLANSDYWTRRPVTVASRLLEVSSTLGTWIAGGRLGSASTAQRADRLRHILTHLGPAYVKIGQAVSSRPDVLEPDFLRELEKLQDRLPPFPNDKAFAVIEAEYQRPLTEIFSYISDTPVAAASLGQVYKAILRGSNEQVAVKVQRPGVATSIALDILVLRRLLVEVRKWRKFNTDLPALLDDWAASLFKELDYTVEAANGEKFKEYYGHLEGVYVPKMYRDLTTRRVLVMEWVDGERLRSAYSSTSSSSTPSSQQQQQSTTTTTTSSSSDDDLRLVEIGVRCSLEQLLEFGFYHADPHPGNLLKTKDGKLAYLDFGMVGQVDEKIRRGLIRATLHLVNREYEALADDFITLGMLPSDSDKSKIVPALTSVFAEALAGGVNNLSFGNLSSNLGRTMYQFKFQIPSYYTLLVRSLSVLEGIALASDPNYKVLSAAYPWVARRLLTDTSPELQSTLTSLLYKDGQFNFKRMSSLLTQATQPTGRPQRRKDDPEGSEPPRGDALALVLSPQGAFIRNIIVEELAKGADAAWRLLVDTSVMDVKSGLRSMAWSTVSSGSGEEYTTNTATTTNDNEYYDHMIPPTAGPLLRSLLEVLSAIPKLAEKEDNEQIEGLKELGAALQQATIAQREQEKARKEKGWVPSSASWMKDAIYGSNNSSSSGSNASQRQFGGDQQQNDVCSTISANIDAAAELLGWALREAETLSSAERLEALKLPLRVGEVLASRIAARAIRWVYSSPVKTGTGAASGAKTA